MIREIFYFVKSGHEKQNVTQDTALSVWSGGICLDDRL